MHVRLKIRSAGGGYATQVFHISTGPNRRCDGSTSQERRPRAVFHNGVGCGKRMKRGDRWICGKPAPVRGFDRRRDGARAQQGSRTLWEAWRCRSRGPRRWRPPSVIVRGASGAPGWVFRDGRGRARSSGPAHRGDCAGKSVVVFERRRWPRRAPRRWRRPTSSRAMRALRPGWAFRAGQRSRRFAGGGPRGDGLGKPVAAFVRWR